jgi:protein-tyrosine phosphatase
MYMERAPMSGTVDFHSHLVAGVDDGAADIAESRVALAAFVEQGVTAAITTPHLSGALTERPEQLAEFLAGIDAGWEGLRAMAAAEFPDLRLERGMEVMLDTPHPDLSDPRVRLAGTSFVLVEFPHMTIPPNSAEAVFELKMKGWTPVIAHPERYQGVDSALQLVEEWRRVGGYLQVNCGSLLKRYGEEAHATAWRLLRRGWVDYLSSDYHARGRCPVAEARAKLVEKNGEEQVQLLMEENPRRLLDGLEPIPVSALTQTRRSFWGRFFRR